MKALHNCSLIYFVTQTIIAKTKFAIHMYKCAGTISFLEVSLLCFIESEVSYFAAQKFLMCNIKLQ